MAKRMAMGAQAMFHMSMHRPLMPMQAQRDVANVLLAEVKGAPADQVAVHICRGVHPT